jgi:hypothetical protein
MYGETDDGEARLHFSGSTFTVTRPGSFVRCAVSARAIALEDLRYWSVERQEPYASAEISSERERSLAEDAT